MTKPRSSDPDVHSLARQDLGAYISAFSPKFQMPPHVRLLIDMFEAVVHDRGNRRQLLSLPPQHGKSEVYSRFGPAWYLGHHPDRNVVFATYSQEFADQFGRRVRNIIADPLHGRIFSESRLSQDSTGASRFHLTRGGSYLAAGRGAGITGHSADAVFLDDVLKDREEASSATERRKMEEWFSQVVMTRLSPNASVVCIGTRWSEADLPGFLLREHADQGWRSLNLPAFAEENDPLGRPEGAPLWPEKFSAEFLLSQKAHMGTAAFVALYQGRPAALEGQLFLRAWLDQRWRELPRLTNVTISLDTAFKTGAQNDWSVATVWGVGPNGYYLMDLWKGRVEFPALRRVTEELAAKHAPIYALLIEDRASGQSLIQALRKETALPVKAVKADRDKETRAAAITPLFESGRIFLPADRPWMMDYVEELATFPSGAHDDQVDSTVQALNFLREANTGPIRIETWRDSGLAAAFDAKHGGQDSSHILNMRSRAAAEDEEHRQRRAGPFRDY